MVRKTRSGGSQPPVTKKRKLVRWDVDTDQELLLTLQYASNVHGIKLPWATTAEIMGEEFTEGAIIQHLAKMRARRNEAGKKVPPPLRRSAKAAAKQAATKAGKRSKSREDDSEDDGLFVSDDDADHGKTPRTAKRTKARGTATKKGNGAQSSTRRGGLRVDLMDDMATGDSPYQFPTFPSAAPSPFTFPAGVIDPRLMDGHGAQTSTEESPVGATRSRVITLSAPPAFLSRLASEVTAQPATQPATQPAVIGYGPAFTQALNPLNPALAYTQAYTPAPPAATFFPAGQPTVQPATFGPGYGGQQQYPQLPDDWYAQQAALWVGNRNQPVQDQGSGVIDPQLLQSGDHASQDELGWENFAADSEEERYPDEDFLQFE